MSGLSMPAILSVLPIRSSRSFPGCRRGRLCRISSMGRRISWTRKGGRWDCDVSGLRGSSRGRVSGWGCWFATSRLYQSVRLPRYMICSIAILPISTGVPLHEAGTFVLQYASHPVRLPGRRNEYDAKKGIIAREICDYVQILWYFCYGFAPWVVRRPFLCGQMLEGVGLIV